MNLRELSNMAKTFASQYITDFPVPVAEIANKIGLNQIVYQRIDKDIIKGQNFTASHFLKRVNHITGEPIMALVVDDRLSQSERRFEIAKGIYKYLTTQSQQTVAISSNCSPSFSDSLSELEAETFAMFLLMPLELTKKEYEDYNGKIVSDNLHEWIRYISVVAKIPEQYAYVGFYNLRVINTIGR